MEVKREQKRRYAQSEKGKTQRRITRREYHQSEEGKVVLRAQCARWRRANPEKYRASMKRHDLKRNYGMTPESWEEMFEKQERHCAACGSADPGRKTGHWSTDHCHKTGVVRGILCNGCNTAAGQVGDSPDRLRKLADYLERTNAGS